MTTNRFSWKIVDAKIDSHKVTVPDLDLTVNPNFFSIVILYFRRWF